MTLNRKRNCYGPAKFIDCGRWRDYYPTGIPKPQKPVRWTIVAHNSNPALNQPVGVDLSPTDPDATEICPLCGKPAVYLMDHRYYTEQMCGKCWDQRSFWDRVGW